MVVFSLNYINKIDINNKNFLNYLENILNIKKFKKHKKIESFLKNIIYNIIKFKEKSLLFYINKFEKNLIKNFKDLKINKTFLEKEYLKLDNDLKFILESSKNRIIMYHQEQLKNNFNNWKLTEECGGILGQKKNSLNNVGFYIPGGFAVYPSSVFMNLIPAKLLNIKNLVVCSPKRINNNLIFSSLYISEVDNLFNFGGVQAITSMAFGNKIFKKVDKICGPGNIYVTLTKKILFGITGIDLLAGPSELTIISDSNSDPNTIVMDLFSQAEHDVLAQSIIILFDYDFISKIENKIKEFIPFLHRKNIVYNSIFNNTLIIKVNLLNEAFNLLNHICPEHLMLCINNSQEFFKNIKNSGSNFLNKITSESFGDYNSGLNHVIPTNKNCMFSSPLGTYDFVKYLNFLKLEILSFNKLSINCLNFSKKENLYSHSDSIKLRI